MEYMLKSKLREKKVHKVLGQSTMVGKVTDVDVLKVKSKIIQSETPIRKTQGRTRRAIS